MGRKLAALLNRHIDARAGDGKPRSDVIASLANAAGIDAGTVNQILDVSIDCPPQDRLESFARALDVSAESIKSAAGEDGCEYSGDETETMAFASEIVFDGDGSVPEWIHLLPAGVAHTVEHDTRGPFKAINLEKLAKDSLAASAGKLPIDQDHATDYVGKAGGAPAPARGWIVELKVRDSGLWGRVEWTKKGAKLLKHQAYRHISPVFIAGKDGVITRLLRAALTNDPAFRQLATLNNRTNTKEDDMDFMEKLREALGLAADADEAAILKALRTKTANSDGEDKAEKMSAQIKTIAKAAGLGEDAASDAVVTAVETLAKGGGDATVLASMQVELATMTTNFNTLNDSVALEKAAAIVDAAIEAGTVGVKPMRDHYIARAVTDPEGVQKELAATPKVSGGQLLPTTPAKDKDGKPGLDETQRIVAKMLGTAPALYAETLAAERAEHEELV